MLNKGKFPTRVGAFHIDETSSSRVTELSSTLLTGYPNIFPELHKQAMQETEGINWAKVLLFYPRQRSFDDGEADICEFGFIFSREILFNVFPTIYNINYSWQLYAMS